MTKSNPYQSRAKREYNSRKVTKNVAKGKGIFDQDFSHALFNHYRLNVTPPGHSRPNWSLTKEEFREIYNKKQRGSGKRSSELHNAAVSVQRKYRDKRMSDQADEDARLYLKSEKIKKYQTFRGSRLKPSKPAIFAAQCANK
jgi:hypothetical protein